MATQIQPDTVPNDRVSSDTEIDHIVCCNDVFITFCGKHVDDPFPVQEITELGVDGTICVECGTLYRNPMFCPKQPCCTNASRR